MAQLHAWHYRWPRRLLPFERDARSAAALGPGEGDFYYHAAVFGGSVAALRRLTAHCARALRRDRARAAWRRAGTTRATSTSSSGCTSPPSCCRPSCAGAPT